MLIVHAFLLKKKLNDEKSRTEHTNAMKHSVITISERLYYRLTCDDCVNLNRLKIVYDYKRDLVNEAPAQL